MRGKLTEVKEERGEPTIKIQEFNTALSKVDLAGRNTEREQLN